jgi:RNA polymerase sigma-70 factor (ECF subfamily)
MKHARHIAPAMESECELVASIAGGDLSGLGVLFDRHGDDVRRLLGRLGMPASDLDDLVQETFLDVMRAAPRFRAGAAVKPWLFGLAAMVARRRRRVLALMVERLRSLAHEWTAQRSATPVDTLEIGAEARRAREALDVLSSKKREAFVLVALEGMSGEEAAGALGVPVATVWTRLHHARRELKRLLAEAP